MLIPYKYSETCIKRTPLGPSLVGSFSKSRRRRQRERQQTKGIAEFTGSNPVEALIFFRLLLSSCLNWKIYCEDHSSLSSITAVQIYELFHIYLHQTKGLMSRTMVLHVRFDSLYISLPSSAKQQREMTKFYLFWSTRTAMANFSCPPLELNAVITYLA